MEEKDKYLLEDKEINLIEVSSVEEKEISFEEENEISFGEEKEISFGEEKKLSFSEEKEGSSREERESLIKEKESLIGIFNEIECDLKKKENKNKSINEIHNKYIDDSLNAKVIKDDINFNCLRFMIIGFSTFFVIINLIGIFQLTTLMKTLFDLILNCLDIFFTLNENNLDDEKKEEIKKKYNFYQIFWEKSTGNEIDFNLMIFTNFIGEIALKSKGFKCSSVIFLVVNVISLILLMNFDFDSYDENYKFSIAKIIYLVICYIALLIGVGSSSLLSQKMLIDSYLKYKNKKISIDRKKLKEKQQEEERKKKKEKKLEEEQKNPVKRIRKEMKEKNEIEMIENKIVKEKVKENDKITDEEKNENKKSNLNVPKKKNKLLSKSEASAVKESKISKKEKEIEPIEESLIENDSNVEEQGLIKHKSVEDILMGDSKEEINYTRRASKTIYIKNNEVELKRSNPVIKKMEEDIEYNTNNKFDSFLLVSISIVLGFFMKYGSNIILDKILKKNNNKYNNDNDFNSKKIFFIRVLFIYSTSIVVSIILYYILSIYVFEQKKKKKEENSYNIYNLCGYIIFTQNILKPSQNEQNIDEPNEKKLNCCLEHLKLFEETIQYCSNRTIANALFCSEKRTYDDECCYCCKCCCGCEHKEKDFEKKNEFFCYCYQAERKHKWLDKFITNDEAIGQITPFLFGYYLSQTTTIGFENLYENKENNWSHFLINCSISLCLFFYLTFSVGRYTYFFNKGNEDNVNKNKDIENKDIEKKDNETISKISNIILTGILSILIFNSIFSIIISPILLNEKNKFDNFWVKNEYILIPILLNKLYHCTLIHFCLNISEKINRYDLISTSTLVSIYIFLWNFIYQYIKGYFDFNSNGLYIIQIIFSSVVLLPFTLIIIFFIIHSVISGYFFYLLFIFISFFTCGTIWLSCLYDRLNDYLGGKKKNFISCRLLDLNPDKFIRCCGGKLGSYCDSNNKCYCQCCFYYGYETNCCDCTECCNCGSCCCICCRC